MNEEFGGSIISMTDDEGNEFELELLDEIEFEGESYSVFVPADIDEMDTEDPDYGLIILKSIEENGEELFGSVDDEDELNRVYDYYMAKLDEEADRENSALGQE